MKCFLLSCFSLFTSLVTLTKDGLQLAFRWFGMEREALTSASGYHSGVVVWQLMIVVRKRVGSWLVMVAITVVLLLGDL